MSSRVGYRGRTVRLAAAVLVGAVVMTVNPSAAHALSPPQITQQPQNLTLQVPGTATFTANAIGNPNPTVQWQRGVPSITFPVTTVWSNIAGATSTTLTFEANGGMDGYQYRAVFTNSVGSATTGAAFLDTETAPTVSLAGFATELFQLTTPDGTKRRSLQVFVGGEPTPAFHWERSNDNGGTWFTVTSDPGYDTNDFLTISLGAADDMAQFRVVATNIYGTAYSPTITARVGMAPVVTTAPLLQNVAQGSTATFVADAFSPTPATVQWLTSPTNSNYTAVPGATSPTFTMTASANTWVQARFTNDFGTATSNTQLQVLPSVTPAGVAPYVVTGPASTTVNIGQPATFTVVKGGGASTVQWQKALNGGGFGNIAGATGTSYTLPSAPQETSSQYRAVLTNAYGNVTSAAAILTVVWPSTVTGTDTTKQAALQFSSSTTPIAMTSGLSVSATTTFQWQKSVDGGATYTDVPGATSSSYTPTIGIADEWSKWRAVATNALGSVAGPVTTVRAGIRPTVTGNPATLTVLVGEPVVYNTVTGSSPTASTWSWERSPTTSGTYVTVAACTSGPVCSFTASAADNGYFYRARLTNDYGTATSTNRKLTVNSSSPAAPTGVTATSGDTTMTVSWTAPIDHGSAITGYVVTPYQGATAGTPIAVGPTPTSLVVPGLTNGTPYSFTVKAVNALGTGPESSPSAALAPAGAPDAPTGVTAVDGDGAATVSWTAPAFDGGHPITGYVVTPSLGSTPQAPVTFASTATTQVINGLDNGGSYTFTVAATNDLGTSTASAASAPVIPAGVPGAPTDVTAVSGQGEATVSWVAPAFDGGRPITGYVVTPSLDGVPEAAQPFASPDTTQVVTGLTDGEAYTFTVEAVNTRGTGAGSAPSDAVTPARAPDAPTGVGAVAGNTRATVSWTAPSFDGGRAVTGYVVTPHLSGVPQTPQSFASAATSQVVAGLTNGGSYTFTVAATNERGTGAASVPSAAVTPVGLVVSSNANPAVTGQPVTLTAVSTVGTTGTVSFYDGATLLGTKTVSGGSASLVTMKLAVGTHPITATYKKTSAATPITSDPLAQVVERGSTTTSLAPAPTPSVFGQMVKLTATVAAVAPGSGTPTGSVSFYDGPTLLGSGAVSSGKASITVKPAVGNHPLTAVYGGSAAWVGSASAPTDHEVGQAATTTALTANVTPSVSGQSVTLTALVKPVAPGAGTPTGTVTFFDGTTLLGAKALSAGKATWPFKPTVGVHDFSAVYDGSASFAGSTGSLSHTVNQAATKVMLTSQFPTTTVGHSGKITATVSALAPGSGVPTGSVEFYDDGVLIATSTITAGKATITIASLTVGTHPLTATYLGDTNDAGSTSSVLIQTIT